VINKSVRSEINQLKVKCSKHGEGCEWIGELGALKTHLESEKGCGFVVVSCPNVNEGCPIVVMRKKLEHHSRYECYFRPYQCEYCGVKGTYQEITGKSSKWQPRHIGAQCHYDECPAYPLACRNNCGASGIKRRDMDDHRSKCPQELVECPFTEAGCTDHALHRHQLDSHLASNQQRHLLIMMGAYKQVKDKQMETEAKLTETEAKLTKKLTETEAKLTETEAKLTTALQLLSRGFNGDRETMNSIIAYSPALMKDGDILMITMPKVSEYHRSGKIWCSPPFHYKEGYKMCLMVRGVKMESAGKCTGLTVNIKLLRGENDDKLKWPIDHEGYCIPPPLPSSRHNNLLVFVRMCGLKQFETTKVDFNNNINTMNLSLVVVNDCLKFDVEYSGCILRVKVECDATPVTVI
jgi:hypothetical protein